ncbi:biotin--[acetyl-CoA-carboxylase] ligase, partial [Candidatus Poribacteria bacterium]|nr:biotin--[acetyl-CoA-carboxylase] ligase [Candidatus Poribacteria bacterium]
TRNPPGEELRALGRAVFNLFPVWNVRVHGEIDSTNAEARRLSLLMGGDAWPRVILADHQTAGRGRRGRSWVAPPHSSLITTVMAPRSLFKIAPPLLPLAVGCWFMEGLERLEVPNVQVKWPNDLLAGGAKIGGILCETAAGALAVGVGINLTQSEEELPRRLETEPQATSVRLQLGARSPGWQSAALTLMSAFLENFEHPADAGWLLSRYRSRCVSLGTSVAFNDSRCGQVVGVAIGIDDTGALRVETGSQGTRAVTAAIEGI